MLLLCIMVPIGTVTTHKRRTIMKKIITVLTICILLFGLASCSQEKDKQTIFPNISLSNENSTETFKSKETESKSGVKDSASTDIGGSDITQDKYRVCYYSINKFFSQLVDFEELQVWKENVYATYPNETNEMVIKRFVQDFNISREDFDEANYLAAKMISEELQEAPMMNPKDYLNQEIYEVYNADIIYTFDDEIINEYYLSGEYPFCYQDEYENAVLSGEYKTQTTDFYFDYDDHSTVKLRGFEYIEKETQLTDSVFIPEETSAIPTEPIEVTAEQTEPIE